MLGVMTRWLRRWVAWQHGRSRPCAVGPAPLARGGGRLRRGGGVQCRCCTGSAQETRRFSVPWEVGRWVGGRRQGFVYLARRECSAGGWAAMFSWPRYPGAGIKWLPVPDAGSAQAGDASLSIAGGLSSPGPLWSREGGWGLVSEGLFGGLISSMKRRLCLWTVVLCVFGVLSLVLCPQRACQRALLLLRWAEVCWPPFERPESLWVLPSRAQMAPVETFKALNQ